MKFTQAEKPFFGRTDILSWVDSWLQKCKGRGIILGIDGMGGIGKTSILHELNKIHKYSIFVDCSTHDMMNLLSTISIRARYIGFDTPRFDYLRDIRLWFLEGIQPAKQKNKGWVKDLVAWIPEINSIVKIATAIITAGMKINQLITKHCESLEQWFKDMLGESYGTKILELFVHNPEQTLNLFLESLVADLNSSPTREYLPLLIMLDSFEYVNSRNYDETPYPDYGIKLNQAEKWHVFLSKLSGAVGLVSGRSLPHIPKKLSIQRYDKEITELDEESCKMLLDRRGITDSQLVQSIINVTHRNPFVISTICDIADRGELHLEEIIKLESEALLEVRERTWNLFFSKAKDIWKFIDCAALIPFFDYEIMHILNPELNNLYWKELVSFSFVQYDEPYWHLHDLARDLALAELGNNTETRVGEISSNLREAFAKTQNPILLGLLLSATNYISENHVPLDILDVIEFLLDSGKYYDIIGALEAYEPASKEGEMIVHWYCGRIFLLLNRIGEARLALSDALDLVIEMDQTEEFDYSLKIGQTHELLGITYMRMGDYKRTEHHYLSSLQVFETKENQSPGEFSLQLMRVYANIGSFYFETLKMGESEEYLKKALKINNALDSSDPNNFHLQKVILNSLGNLYRDTGRILEAKRTYNQAAKEIEELDGIPSHELNDTLSKIYNNLGLLYYNTEEFEKARQCYNKTLGILTELADKQPELYRDFLPGILTNIGLLDAIDSDFENAIDNYEKALSMYREFAKENPGFYTRDIAMVLMNLGLAYRSCGEIEKAIPVLEESTNIYEKLSYSEMNIYSPRLANALGHLGVAYLHSLNFENAGRVLKKSLDIFENLNPEILRLSHGEYAFALNHMGTLQFRKKQFELALSYFRKSLTLFEEESENNPSGYLPYVGMTLSNISGVYIEEEECEKAEENALHALRIYSKVMKNRSLVFRDNVLNLISNLTKLYLEKMNLSPEDVDAKLRMQLGEIFGSEMTKDILKSIIESSF